MLRKYIYFVRYTNSPLEDLEVGFSCNGGCLVKEFNKAVSCQKNFGVVSTPKYDKYKKLWCYDPEIGLTGFGFDNEVEYEFAMRRMYDIICEESMGLFKSDDYDYHAGLNYEDVFRNGIFLGFINVDMSYEDIVKKYNIK